MNEPPPPPPLHLQPAFDGEGVLAAVRGTGQDLFQHLGLLALVVDGGRQPQVVLRVSAVSGQGQELPADQPSHVTTALGHVVVGAVALQGASGQQPVALAVGEVAGVIVVFEVRGVLGAMVADPAGDMLAQSAQLDLKQVNVQGNRLLTQGDAHFDYDVFGNLVRERRGAGQKLVAQYRYDCQHRLSEVLLPNGQVAKYRYDAFDRRIEKDAPGAVTEFFWRVSG